MPDGAALAPAAHKVEVFLSRRRIGEGKDVTMYCFQNVYECNADGDTLWRSKTATVVSGTIEEQGIKNCQYAHVVLDTWALNDYYASTLSAPGTYRIWYDGDSLATRLTN